MGTKNYVGSLTVNGNEVITEIEAISGTNINSVGTPSVEASTVDGKTTLTFNNLKGEKGNPGTSVSIVSISESDAPGDESIVTFSDGKTLSIYNGNDGVTPTIKAQSGANISSVGTPSVTATTSGTTTTFTFNNLKGEKGDKGDNATTTAVATQDANGLMSSTDKKTLDTLNALLQDDTDTTINTIAEVLKAFETMAEGANLATLLGEKVDKVTGKGLSTNDFTTAYKTTLDSLAKVATSGSYNDLSGKPTIPTTTSQLTNDSGFLTEENYKGTVTSVKVGTTSYTPNGGIVSLPAYPSYSNATTSNDGLMSAGDKKLIGLLYQDNLCYGFTTESGKSYMEIDDDEWTMTIEGDYGVDIISNNGKLQYNGKEVATTDVATISTNGLMSSTDKTKLNGIASGAEVNVQSDWNVTDETSDAFIKNKPSIPSVGNGTIIIKQNGSEVGKFETNQSGNTTVELTDTKYTLPLADSAKSGGVTSGGDVTISKGIITVNDDSHNHIISNVDGLQTALDGKLGASTQAVDSAKLNGQEASYYLNYNNLSNKPTIPSAITNPLTLSSQSNYNANTCYDGKVWLIASGSNCPSGSQFGSLFTMPYRQATGNTKPDFATQIFIPNGDDSTKPNSMFYRTALRESWNAWQEVATTNVVTTSANGLMSASDKSKLDGIATGATKTTVDTALSSTSTNPVQNKVINSALAGKASATDLTALVSRVTTLENAGGSPIVDLGFQSGHQPAQDTIQELLKPTSVPTGCYVYTYWTECNTDSAIAICYKDEDIIKGTQITCNAQYRVFYYTIADGGGAVGCFRPLGGPTFNYDESTKTLTIE